MTKVLIVDDEVAVTDIIKLILEPAGFDVLTLNSSEEGIDAARQWNPDIIVLDLLLPSMDGWQVCQTIREFSEVPILVISAVTNPTMVARALDAGADEVLNKPVRADILIAQINKLIRRVGMNTPPFQQSDVVTS